MAASSSGSSHVLGPNPFASPIQEGNRLYLLGKSTDPDKNLTAYAIGVKTFEKPTFWSKLFSSSDVVPIQGKVNNKNVKYNINVKTVARQLGLSEQKVRKIAQKVDGIDLLTRQAKIHFFMKDKEIKTKYQNSKIKSFKIGGKVTGQRFFIDEKNLNFYQAQELRQGSFGKVYIITSLIEPEGPTFALKKAKRKKEKATKDLENEAEVLRKINRFGDIPGIQVPPTLTAGGSYITHLYEGDLIDMVVMDEFQKMEPKDKLKLMSQLIIGLSHLHNSGYFHGDIKPENCLVEKDKTSGETISNVVLSDFGGVNEVKSWDVSGNLTKTLQYLAPEMLTMRSFTASAIQQSDVYALSKTILEILIGENIGNFITLRQYEKLKTIIPEPLAQVLTDGMSLVTKAAVLAEDNAESLIINEDSEKNLQNSTSEPVVSESVNETEETANPKARPTAKKLLDRFIAAFEQQYGENLL